MTTQISNIKEKTNRNLYLAILLVFFSFSIYSFLFYKVVSMEQSNSRLEKETKRLEDEESKLAILKKNLESTGKSQSVISSYFIDSKDIVPFLEKLEAYADVVGVKVTFDTVDLAKAPSRLNISFTSVGQFKNTYRFMKMVETAPFEVVINGFEIKALPPETAPEKGKPIPPTLWKAQVEASIFSITGVK